MRYTLLWGPVLPVDESNTDDVNINSIVPWVAKFNYLCMQEILVLRRSSILTSIGISTPSSKPGCRVRNKKKKKEMNFVGSKKNVKSL